MNNFKLTVYTTDKIFFDGECPSLVIPTPDGLMGIQAGHENMVVALIPGEMHIKIDEEEDKWLTAAVSRGFAEVVDNKVSVLVNTAEYPDEIDIKRAEIAKERAEEQMRQKQSLIEFHTSQASLARALTRLKTTRDRNWKI